MTPEFYGWVLVSILLAVAVIAIFWLLVRTKTHGDDIRYLITKRDEDVTTRDSQKRKLETAIGALDLSYNKMTKVFKEDLVKVQEEAVGVAVAEAKAAKAEFNLHRTGVYEPKVKALEESIGIVDESVGLLEKRVSEMDGLQSALVNDGVEFFRAKNDFTLTCDRHEKRLNDQMTHVTGMEKKVAVLTARVDGQDNAGDISLYAIKTLGQVYVALLAQGTFITVDSAPAPKASRRQTKGRKRA